MSDLVIPVSPLALNQLTRAYWGQYDAAVCAQLAQLASDPCYRLKLYKAPADNQENMAAYAYVTYGMRITPGSLIYGIYLPAIPNAATPTSSAPGQFTVQVTDVSLDRKRWDEPVGSLLLSNFKPTFQAPISSASAGGGLNMGSFPTIWGAPYPVVGSGLFDVEIQETSGSAQRIELIFGVLEVCDGQ